jgi:hypothetical protein
MDDLVVGVGVVAFDDESFYCYCYCQLAIVVLVLPLDSNYLIFYGVLLKLHRKLVLYYLLLFL